LVKFLFRAISLCGSPGLITYLIAALVLRISKSAGWPVGLLNSAWKVTDAASGVTDHTYDASHRILTIHEN
jgi:hypothetical protein